MTATELVVLDRAQCLELLGTTTTGRLAYSVHGTPRIEVVNFLLDEGGTGAVIRMAASSRSAAVGRGESFALEIDRIDESSGTGWSVTAIGRAVWVSDRAEVRRLDPLLRCDAPGDRPFFARISFGHVFGRRLG